MASSDILESLNQVAGLRGAAVDQEIAQIHTGLGIVSGADGEVHLLNRAVVAVGQAARVLQQGQIDTSAGQRHGHGHA